MRLHRYTRTHSAARTPQPKRVHVVYDVGDRHVTTITCDDGAALSNALEASDRRHVLTLDVADLRLAINAAAAATASAAPAHGRGATWH